MRPAVRDLLLLAMLAGLSACGAQADLKPRAGHALPVAPLGQNERPAARDLLASQTQARPGRNVELHTRSEIRTDDPFDLPPQD